MELGIKGKIALVTGGSRGIGRTIAYALASEGVDVAICARTKGPLEATAHEIGELTGRRIFPVVADISNTDSVDAMVASIVAELGGLHILINNAAVMGGMSSGPIARVRVDALLEDFNIKTVGYLRCVRAVAPVFQKQRWGRIVNIGGRWARVSGSMSAGVRNAAIVNITKNLADELGRDGVTVNVIHPPTNNVHMPSLRELARRDPAIEPAPGHGARNAIGRGVLATDVADAALFLCSTRAGAITGQVIDVSGGEGDAIFY